MAQQEIQDDPKDPNYIGNVTTNDALDDAALKAFQASQGQQAAPQTLDQMADQSGLGAPQFNPQPGSSVFVNPYNKEMSPFGAPAIPAPDTAPSNPNLGLSTDQNQTSQKESDNKKPKNELADISEDAANAYIKQGQLEADAARANEALSRERIEKNQQMIDNFNKYNQEWDNHLNQAVDDVRNQHINPNHYFESMDTGQKIGTAIGMLLGSASGGMLRTENPVMKYLNNQVERDVQSQVANANQKNNVYRAILEKVGNDRVAQRLTLAFQNQLYADKIEQQSLKFGGPIAQARAQVLAAPFREKAAMYRNQGIAMGMSAQGGPGSGISPEQQILMLKNSGRIDNKQYEAANKELGDYATISSVRKAYEESVNHLKGMAMNGLFSPSDRKSAIKSLAGKLTQLSDKRYNQQAAENLMESIFPGIVESSQTTENKIKRGNALLDTMVTTPTLKGLTAIGFQMPDDRSPNQRSGGQ
jgi:hypothetical protein